MGKMMSKDFYCLRDCDIIAPVDKNGAIMKNTRKLIYTAMMTAIIAACSWISIPAVVPFTLQTFAVFCALGLLGWSWGALSISVYILLGAFGLPVFSGFVGGMGHLVGPTAGYIWGFLLAALIYGILKKLLGKAKFSDFIALTAGLVGCYTFGTLWFVHVYTGDMNYLKALSMCVFPFIIHDLIKMFIACKLVDRVKPHFFS